MFSRKQKLLLLKLFSLFSIVRGYNILVLAVAQYLAARYIFASQLGWVEVLLDANLFMLVLASATAIAAGYIINNFYDSEKDLINKPRKTMLDRLVSQPTKLTAYFIFNFVSIIFASYVSFRAVLFFSIYVFALWLYSHKLKRILAIGNMVSAILAVTPFFAIFIYYKNFEIVIFGHAAYLFSILLMKEIIKDLENIKGDLVQNYQTLPLIKGITFTKIILAILVGVSWLSVFGLLYFFELAFMRYYFYISSVLLLFMMLALLKSNTKRDYIRLHNLLKLIVVLGVISIPLLDKTFIKTLI